VYKTPSFSTIVGGTVAICYYLGMTLISDNILQDSISSARPRDRVLLRHHRLRVRLVLPSRPAQLARELWVKGIFPLLGALMLTFAFVQSAIDMFDVDYGNTVLLGIGGTFVVGIGALLVGVVLMFVWYLFPRSKPFFQGALNRETVLVPEEPGDIIRSIDGGI
jgi:hypothetical protein